MNTLAATFQAQGKLVEAEKSYKQAIILDNQLVEAMLNFAILLEYQDDLRRAVLWFERVRRISRLNQGLRAGVSLAILKFLKGDFNLTRTYLRETSAVHKVNSSLFKNDQIYHTYLSRIIEWHKTKELKKDIHTENKRLFIIGESHSLVSHKLYFANPSLTLFGNQN